jgi:hypothetical protein
MLPAPEAWLARSTGVVSNASEDPAVSESLRCARVFGTGLDFVCLCGALSGRDTAGAACEQCGVSGVQVSHGRHKAEGEARGAAAEVCLRGEPGTDPAMDDHATVSGAAGKPPDFTSRAY